MNLISMLSNSKQISICLPRNDTQHSPILNIRPSNTGHRGKRVNNMVIHDFKTKPNKKNLIDNENGVPWYSSARGERIYLQNQHPSSCWDRLRHSLSQGWASWSYATCGILVALFGCNGHKYTVTDFLISFQFLLSKRDI